MTKIVVRLPEPRKEYSDSVCKLVVERLSLQFKAVALHVKQQTIFKARANKIS